MGGKVIPNAPRWDQADLPQAGDSVIIDLDNTIFTGLSDSIFSQDENQGAFTLFTFDGDWNPQNVSLVFKSGNEYSQGSFKVDNGDLATFSYSVPMFNVIPGVEAFARFVLTNINLNSTAGYGQFINVSAKEDGGSTPDLKASLTGTGNVTFGFSEAERQGYLTLAGSEDNTYTGKTYVGYAADGQVSASPTTIYFGKNKAFGETLNLNVESASSVYISGETGTEDYEQKVLGLQGEGLIHLGTQAKLTLDQSGTGTGNYSADEGGFIRIDNKFAGTGNADDPTAGAWFDIKLSGDVAGDIVRFSDNAVYDKEGNPNYTGVIALENGAIEAYDEDRRLDPEGRNYSPNLILTTSTLRLENNGRLLVDGTSGADTVHNLFLNNSADWMSGAANNNALSFENVGFGGAALTVTGDLTLEKDATVNVDSFTETLDDAVAGKSFFDADGGLESALIVVEGEVDLGNDYKLHLKGEATGDSGTDVTQGGNIVAKAHWDFSDTLKYVSGGDESDSFNIEYTLKQIDIVSGQTFTLETADGSSTEGQDFTALITGSGNLTVDASGFTVNIGNSGGNIYTGDTTVTGGTNVILTENKAFGTGSGTLTIEGSGSVTLGNDVKQSGSGLSGAGSLVLGSGSEYALTQNSDATIDNIISGSGTLKVDLINGNELKFTAGRSFAGTLDLINAALDLTDSGNAGTLGSSSIVLGDNTDFTFGKGGNVRDLHVKGDADLNADTLIIGGDAVLSISGSLSYDRDLSFDVENVEVAADLNLIDYDGAFVGNKFIEAGSSQGQGSVSIAVSGGQQVELDYTQNGDIVAETTWDIGTGLTDNGTGLDASVQLKAINVLGANTLSIYGKASGQKELSAKLSSESASGTVVFTGGDILVSYGANDYTAATHIDNGATVELGASHALGETSELANYGKLVVNTGISQTVYGWADKADGSIELNGSLLLNQSGEQSIANTFAGSGLFFVDLANSNNELFFASADAFNGFSGTLSLGNLTFDAAETSSSLLRSTDVVINGGAIFIADSVGTPVQTSDFTFNGGTFRVGQIEAGNNTGAKLAVSGDINIDSASTIELEGVKLEGTQNILAADQGVEQTIATYTGAVSSNLDDLKVSGVGTSEIRNNSSDADPAAYGKWSAGALTAESGKLDVRLTLEEIQLADTDVGLKLDATELTGDTTISAKITDYETTAGKIVFEGGNITIGGGGANTYTGETEVIDGTVTLAKNSGFGTTSKLSIASGGAVVLGDWMQTVGALEIGSEAQNAMNALSGLGTLTIGTGQTGTSHIWGSNSFTGTVQLTANHNLSINSVDGVGGNATVGFGDNSVLTIDGATGGEFTTNLSGSGTVAVSDSTFEVSGSNSGFNGTWQLGNSGNVSVSGTSADIDNALGSGAKLNFSNGSLSLQLATGETALTIDEVLSGSGDLVVQGTNNQTFGLSADNSAFTGTLSLEGIGMTVGAGTDSYGANNAQAFAGADLNLSKDALLTVASGTSTDVFGTVTVIDSARFDLGALGFQSVRGQGSAAAGTTQLLIDKLVANEGASGTIILDLLGTSRDLAGVVNENALLAGGIDAFQTLIATGETINEALLGRFSLSGAGSEQVTQNIQSNGIDVATGYYDFELATGGDNNSDLGVSYDLTRIDISGGKTLTLFETGTLDAQLTSESGAGKLTIAAGGNITLANDSADALNGYTGVTNVLGTLTAHANNLGNTSELLIGTDGHYINAGDNKVGHLNANGTLELLIDKKLEITQGAGEISNIAGTLTGGGDLSFAAGDLIVTGTTTPSVYAGTVYVGNDTSDAVLTISGAGALGRGSIVLGKNNGSAVNIYGTEDQTFVNEISGFGKINVNLSGGGFTFGTEQTDLSTGSTLVLDDAIFDLTASDVNFNDDVAGKLAIELTDGSKLINDGSADKAVYSLTLNGGTIDLGEINTEFGQINLVSEEGTLNIFNKTTIDIASQSDDNVTESGDRTITDGSELLTGGFFYLDIFTGVKKLNGIENLVLEQGFSGTTEKLLQDADPDSEGLELVANMTRDDGAFKYDGSKVYLEYRFKEIELLRDDLNQGLLVDAEQKPGGTLSAKITGSGNLKLDGTLNLGATDTVNDYTGITYVLGDGVVTVQADSAFGKTKELDIASGGVVKLNGFDQTVGALSGTGKLEFASGSEFILNNYLDKDGAQEIVIKNELVAAAGATFTIDGTYGTGENDHASVSFGSDNNNSLAGMTFTLRNAKFDIGGTNDFDYLTSASSSDFVLSTGAAMSVDGTSGNLYNYNELSFAGGSLDVTNVTLVKQGTDASADAVIKTYKLDLNGSGTLSVAAKIDENFNVLSDDQANFVSTLIEYENLVGNPLNLNKSSAFSSSAIEQGGNPVAYVNWDGTINIDEKNKNVGMSYHVAAIQLADESGKGLALSTTSTANDETTSLDALVTDYGSVRGNLTFEGGSITVTHTNTYTGVTNVTAGSVATAAEDAFGKTRLLNVSGGSVTFNNAQHLGSLFVAEAGGISGSGSITLGLKDYEEDSSEVHGANTDFTGNITLDSGHTLTLDDTHGVGDSGSINFLANEKLVINDDDGGDFSKSLISSGTSSQVELDGTNFNIIGNNANYQGNWTFTDGTTVNVAGDDNVSADERLGSSGTVTLGHDSGSGTTLTISQNTDDIILDNAFAGSGTLVVSGNGAEQRFGFENDWSLRETFNGTVEIRNGITMTVGGTLVGANNSVNLANADFNLGDGSTLIVATQLGSIVDTFDNLNVAENSTIRFNGELGIGADTDELGRLQVGSLEGSGNIELTLPAQGDTVDQSIEQNTLLTIDGQSQFQALITAENGEVDALGWTLNSGGAFGSGLRQKVNKGDNETVAHAIYEYQLAVGDTDGNNTEDSLGIEFTLTTVDILGDKTLELSDDGTLSAKITDSSGFGNLLITNGKVELKGENDYEGSTEVSGEGAVLTVGKSGLGKTSGLTLGSGTAFVNEGANQAGYIDADQATVTVSGGDLTAGYVDASGATIDLVGKDDVLVVTGTSGSSISGGTVKGEGTLTLQDSELKVSGTEDNGYSGRVNVGTANQDATLHLENLDGIGSGVISLNSETSTLKVTNVVGTVLTNTVSGSGIIDVSLGSSDRFFEFDENQGTGFTGTLRLSKAAYRLVGGADELVGARLETANDALVVVNTAGNVDDRTIGSLTLNGGVLDFGSMAEGSDSGQIVVGSGSGGFTIGSEKTTVKVGLGASNDENGSGVFVGNDGMSLSIIDIKDFNENTDISNIVLHADSDELTQAVNQTDGHTANLTFSGGRLDATGSGIDALWDLTSIKLLVEADNSGFRVDATDETSSAGTITAKITGTGNIVFEGGTVTVANNQNDYTGDTYVTDGLLVLGTSEALGNTGLLNVTGGAVNIGATSQSIGSLDIAVENGLRMTTGGSIELTSGSSVIASANEGITGGAFKLDSGVKLTIENERGAGSVEGERGGADISMQSGASVVLAFGEETDYGYFSNKLAGENGQYGTVQIGNGENAAYVDLVNTANNFDVLHVAGEGHVRINGMDGTQTALGGADVVIDDNGVAILNGNGSWTLANAFDLSSGGELRLTAGADGNGGYNTVKFSNASTQQIDKGGKVTLADAVLYLDRGSNAANADVLANAHLNLESNASLNVGTVAQGYAGLELNSLTLAGGDIYFGGILSVGADQTTLGHLTVNTLGDLNGTVHLTASRQGGTGGSIQEGSLLDAAKNGRYQSLIDVTGETIKTEDLAGIGLVVTDENGSGDVEIISSIKDSDGVPLAEGTFGYGDKLVAGENGTSAGVNYTLQLINLLNDRELEISESGGLDVRITGEGSLLVSNELELTNKTGEKNDYTGTTTVADSGQLTAGAGALGTSDSHTSALNVSGNFTNAGDNVVDSFNLSGSADLNNGTTLTVTGAGKNAIAGGLSGLGSLDLAGGTTTVTSDADAMSDYSGAVALGKNATLDLGAAGSLGTGAITTAADSLVKVEANGARTLTNTLKGAATLDVSGSGIDSSSFAFNAGQDDLTSGFAGALSLTSVTYDFTQNGNDALKGASLTLDGVKLVVNDSDSVGNRLVNGLTINGTGSIIDFGQIGNGTGVINLQGNDFDVNAETTVTLETELASAASSDGSAAFDKNVSGALVTLVTDAKDISEEDLNHLVSSVSGQNVSRDIKQGGDVVAKLLGTFGGFSVSGESGHQDLNLGLGFSQLEIQGGKTYSVSETGSISLKITDVNGKGDLTVTGEGNVLTLTNGGNEYEGATNVLSGADLVLTADSALGKTELLNTASGTSVDFSATSQTVGMIKSDGLLKSDANEQGTQTLTVAEGGSVVGANNDFHLKWVLNAGDLQINNVMSLGTGSAEVSDGASIVIVGAEGEFTNALTGAGGLRVTNGANVELAGSNALKGGLTVLDKSAVSASGDIYEHIGTGPIALDGTAVFTLTEGTDVDSWNWDRKVSGKGNLTFAREGLDSQDLSFTDGTLKNFGGNLTLDNWIIRLSTVNGQTATFDELSGSKIGEITLRNSARADVTGDVSLAGKNLWLENTASLTFNGVGVPGASTHDNAHITVDELHLGSGFNIDLGISNASVKSEDLIKHDKTSDSTLISVATALEGIFGEVKDGTVTVNGEETIGKTIRFGIDQGSGSVLEESGDVGDAIYGYDILKETVNGHDKLQISYSLEGIDIGSRKTLVLNGVESDAEGEDEDSTLGVYLTGKGSLRIAGNTVRLSKTEHGNDYLGTTTVSSGATLYAEEGTLGQTARLTTESGARTYIEGDNTVKGFTLAADGQLVIGDISTMGDKSDVTLTISSLTDKTTPSDQINHLSGQLHGNGVLKVVGNGQYDEGVDADLTIHGSQSNFYGDLVLENGAWVDIEANSEGLFGNEGAANDVVLSKKSRLTIESSQSGPASFHGVFKDGTDGGGTVEISLNGSDDHFRFADAQAEEIFTGTFTLNNGTISYNDLFTTNSGSGDPLAKATLALNVGGNVILSDDAQKKSLLGGLTMNGGTIHAGAIGYTAGEGSSTSRIDLNGGDLNLADGSNGQISNVIFDASSGASQISAEGSEILTAGSIGSDVVLIENIGETYLDGDMFSGGEINSNYLHASLPADALQLVKQEIGKGSGKETVDVAEVKRQFTDEFYYDKAEGTLAIAYTVSEIGLLHQTKEVGGDNFDYRNDDNWQGLTLTAFDAEYSDSIAFATYIKDGSHGEKGNIVFRGAEGADSITLELENGYTGKTWLTDNVQVVFGDNSGFGTTEALRVDAGSSVNFAGFDQTMGALFALGSDALKGAGNLTVNGVAVIEGANADLSANWIFNDAVTINNAKSLGTGSVALAGASSKLTVNGANGNIANAFTGGDGTSLVLTNGANVNFTTEDTLGGKAFTGSVDVASGTSAGFTLTSGTAIGNELDVTAGGTLRISSENGGNLSFANSETNISGTLDITNVTLNAAANKDRFTNASLSAHAGAVFEVTEVIGEGVFKDLSFTDGSTIKFANGTPGEYGDNAARIDLGDEGTLSFAETVNIELDLDDYVNASEVSEIQTGLQNKRLTAQDLTTKNESVLSNLISAGKVNGGLEDLNLEASGASGGTLTIGIRNDDRDTEDVAEGTYGFKLNTNGGLNLAYGLTSVKIKDGKTLKLAGVGSSVSEDNILTAAVHGTGDLEITEGLIALTNGGTDAGKSTYTGQTIVDAHAQLVAGTAGGTLGETSKLDLKGYERQSEYDDGFGGRAHILGAETVGSLNVGENAVLNISDSDSTNGHLTIEGKAESTINGVLRGAGGLDVQGSTLTVTTSNTGFTGDVSVASGATIVINQLDSLGAKDTAGVIKLAEGGNLNVTSELEVDATSSASRTVGTISSAVTGDGTVVVNLTTSNDSEARFSFADSQTGGEQATEEDPGFTGTIRLENGGFTLAFAADDHTVSTANQRAAWNAEIEVGSGGSLYVSQRDHENARFVDKHIRALTLNGGNIYFGGLRYDMQSLENQLGGQLELDGENGGTLSINDISTVNLDAGTTNSLSDNGSELLIADEGAQIDLIQHAKDVLVKGNSVVGMTDEDIKALNDNLKLNISNEDAWQTLSQKGIEVAEVLRTVGSSDGDAFGVEESSTAQGLYDLYLNYHVQEVRLINKEQGLLVSNTTGKDQTFSAKLTGDGDITFAGGSITIGDGDTDVTNDVANANTGSVFVRDGRVTAGKDTAFGDGSTLIVADGGSVDFGDFDQTLGVLEARGDDALIGGEGSVITITDDMIVTGENDEFHSKLELKFSGEGLVTDVDGLGDGDISIGEDYTLILADEELSGTDKNLVENNIDGAGTVVVGSDGATGTIELGGKNSGLTGDVTVKDGWTLEASMGANESASDRIGNGTLILEGEGSNASFTQTESENGKGLVWDTDVSGSGNLKLTAKADESITISGGLDGFAEGTVTIGGGRLDLGTGNETNLGSADLVATGDNASINIKDVEGGVDYEGNITVGNDANIVFERPATPGTTGDASLRVDGSLDLEGALVTVMVDDSLSLGDPGTVDLNVQDVLSADRSSDLALVIAEADGGIGNLTGDALIKDQEGNVIDLKSKGIAINDSTGKVATGYYDYDLSVSEDGKQLGVAYQLTRVDIVENEKLVLQGVTSSDTNNPDVQNAMRLSADLTGKGSFQLTGGLLTLEGDANDYSGNTIVGNEGTGASTTLIVSEGSSLGNTNIVQVNRNATLTNRSDKTTAKNIQVVQGGTLNLDGGVFTVSGGSAESMIAGSLTGDGALVLGDDITMNVSAENASGYTGVVTVGDGATYNVVATTSETVHVSNSFASDAGDAAEVGLKGNLFLGKSNVKFHGTFMLSGGSVFNADSIDALGADDAMIDVGDSGTGFVVLTYANEEAVGQVEQGMTNSISFIKDGAGVVSLSDDAMGAGTVTAREGGILFGTAGQSTAYNTALNIEKDGWAAGFGGVSSLKVDLGGSFYVGGRSGYNSVLTSTVAKVANEDPASNPSANSNTAEFVVSGDVTNAGTIYVGNKNADGSAPADSSSIGNELVITGDYNVTASDNGGIFDMNAIIAGEDSIADHVTIRGKINGEGYVDVNYDSSVSTGGTLEYLGLVKVEGGDDGDSLRLKDSIQIGDLYYRLMWSSKENEYYLQSSVTDPGDKPWDTEDVENVNAGTRSALAFMQAQAFDLSLRGHLGETLYVDPVTGEQRKSSFWMVQRGDWTKFSNASGQLDADGNLYTTHLGTDLFKRETDGATFRWGVLAGFADGDFDVSSNVDGKSSKGSFRGYSAGLYMTAESKAESGPFLGLQLRWNRFDSEVGQDDYDVNGLSLTAEASWDQLLSKGITDGGRNYEWRLEPHVRAYWTNFGDPDDWTSSLGETYSSDFDNGLLVRVGARTKIQTTLGTGPAWQAYAEANWVYNNGDYSTTMSTKYGDVTSTQNGAEFAEFRLGLEAQFTTNVNVWLEGHHQTGSDDYESTGAMFGFKYMW